MECSPCRIDVREMGRDRPAIPVRSRAVWVGWAAVVVLVIAIFWGGCCALMEGSALLAIFAFTTGHSSHRDARVSEQSSWLNGTLTIGHAGPPAPISCIRRQLLRQLPYACALSQKEAVTRDPA
jgi:hypothetical protein